MGSAQTFTKPESFTLSLHQQQGYGGTKVLHRPGLPEHLSVLMIPYGHIEKINPQKNLKTGCCA